MTQEAHISEAATIGRATPMKQHRFHLLDAMRGAAALLVVMFHAPTLLKAFLNFPNSFLAVNFFFCLSGFVIAFSYAERLRKDLTLRSFFVLRMIRLYPLYALGTILAIVRLLIFFHLPQNVPSWRSFPILIGLAALFIPNAFMAGPGIRLFPFNVPAWSLFFEILANVAFAYLVPRRFAKAGLFLILLASLVTLLVVARNGSSMNLGSMREGMFVGFARVGFSFVAGVLLFHIFRRRSALPFRSGLSWAAPILLLCLLLASLMLAPRWVVPGIYQCFVIVFVFPMLVYLGATCSVPPMFNRSCAFLGDMSYPLYMLHVPLGLPEFDHPSRLMAQHARMLPFVLPFFIVILVIVSWSVGHFWDVRARSRLTSMYKSFLRHREIPAQST